MRSLPTSKTYDSNVISYLFRFEVNFYNIISEVSLVGHSVLWLPHYQVLVWVTKRGLWLCGFRPKIYIVQVFIFLLGQCLLLLEYDATCFYWLKVLGSTRLSSPITTALSFTINCSWTFKASTLSLVEGAHKTGFVCRYFWQWYDVLLWLSFCW